MPKIAPMMPHPRKLASIRSVTGFWRDVLDRNRVSSLPDALEKISRQGRLDNFRIAAGVALKRPIQIGPWDDSDVYKWVEAASMALLIDREAGLRQQLDVVVDLIVAAQEPSGYIDTRKYVLGRPTWDHEHTENHVLYNNGHLIEAAIAHRQATGTETLFNVAIKVADCIDREFGPGRRAWAPQHQEIELALVKLYEETGEQRYLDLALFFLEQRGRVEGRKPLGIYQQDNLKVRDQFEVAGHSVLGLYQNIAIHDVACHTADAGLYQAQELMWQDMVSSKLLISGGAGRVHEGPNGLEGFRHAFDLGSSEPDVDTCTSIAVLLWAQRRLAHTDDKTFGDFVEYEIYNRILAGVSLQGTQYFYGMPLESLGREGFDGCGQAGPAMGASEHYRQPWYRVPCCPSNIQRILALFPALALRATSDVLTVDQFVGLTETIEVGNAALTVRMATGYPFDGQVSIGLGMAASQSFTLRLRLPSWLDGLVMDGQLYRGEASALKATVFVNGEPHKAEPVDGYLTLSRAWADGDEVRLELPMAPRLATADVRAKALRGQSALLVGPLLYCAEGPANTIERINLTAALAHTLSQHVSLPVLSLKLAEGQEMVPLFAWDNRGPSAFKVWFDQAV